MTSLRNLIIAAATVTVSTLSFGQSSTSDSAAQNAREAGAEVRQETREAGAEVREEAREARDAAGSAVNSTERAAERSTDAARSDTATSSTTTTTTTTEVESERSARAARADRN